MSSLRPVMRRMRRCVRPQSHGADEGHGGHAGAPRSASDAGNDFAASRLIVEPPLARDAQKGIFRRVDGTLT